jgi:hypothetical protein
VQQVETDLMFGKNLKSSLFSFQKDSLFDYELEVKRPQSDFVISRGEYQLGSYDFYPLLKYGIKASRLPTVHQDNIVSRVSLLTIDELEDKKIAKIARYYDNTNDQKSSFC